MIYRPGNAPECLGEESNLPRAIMNTVWIEVQHQLPEAVTQTFC